MGFFESERKREVRKREKEKERSRDVAGRILENYRKNFVASSENIHLLKS